MRIVAVILICLWTVGAFGQTAEVTQLSTSDAAEAKRLYEAKQSADKAWDEYFKRIQKSLNDKNVWTGSGIEFSKDFLFVVPKQIPVTGSGVISWPNCWGGTTVNPASSYIPFYQFGSTTQPGNSFITTVN